MSPDQRYCTWTTAGQTYTAPEYWLQARALAHELSGEPPMRARWLALHDWQVQAELERSTHTEEGR